MSKDGSGSGWIRTWIRIRPTRIRNPAKVYWRLIKQMSKFSLRKVDNYNDKFISIVFTTGMEQKAVLSL